MTINGREKGARFERDMAKAFSDWTGIPWDRTFQSGGGKQKGDIAPVNGATNLCVELKRREGWSLEHLLTGKGEIWEWYRKVAKEAREGKQHPLLVAKRSRVDALVLLPLNMYSFFFGDSRPRYVMFFDTVVVVRLDDLLATDGSRVVLTF